ncbi:GL26940 [Drosophila persimilis]|uniref:GL26940 n=1 Tax=Drosophila persimilis TaxID=7234 RepID=B4IRZ6_DROPE|nr:GL26940 [Drosophila persimilis]
MKDELEAIKVTYNHRLWGKWKVKVTNSTRKRPREYEDDDFQGPGSGRRSGGPIPPPPRRGNSCRSRYEGLTV